jgi:hypothetical protein
MCYPSFESCSVIPCCTPKCCCCFVCDLAAVNHPFHLHGHCKFWGTEGGHGGKNGREGGEWGIQQRRERGMSGMQELVGQRLIGPREVETRGAGQSANPQKMSLMQPHKSSEANPCVNTHHPCTSVCLQMWRNAGINYCPTKVSMK